MLKRDYHLFNIAKAVSKSSDYRKIKIGCVIAERSEIISIGVNRIKSHPLQKRLNCKYYSTKFSKGTLFRHGLHAELHAILNAGDRDLSGARIYIYREDHNGNMALCRPCPACMEAIRKKGIRKVYYTTPDGYAEETIK